MMKSYAMNRKWYEEIKDRVKTENPYFYTDEYSFFLEKEMVEVDVDEEEFIKVSEELGWI